MRFIGLRPLWLASLCVGALAGTACQAAAQTVADATVRVLAGSGAAGISDGVGSRATFLMPSAVAYGPDRRLYVADAAAQRIRAIEPNGVVKTVAGGGAVGRSGLWVRGAFRDGTARDARFDGPSGVAVRSDGAIYVADTFNHCIRLIRSSVVSTIAGRCGTAGTADGPLHRNLMQYPRGLSVGADGTLYIADQKNGVRTLSRNGLLRTLPPPRSLDFRTATGIAATDFAGETQLYIANADQLILYRVRSHAVFIDYDRGARTDVNLVQGGGPLGRPYSICALARGALLYGDLRDGSLRYIEDFVYSHTAAPHVQYVGETPPENATLGLTQRSGTASFSAPMGIALSRDGRVAVADAVKRKIMLVDIVETRHSFNAGLAGLAGRDAGYRIAIEGNSFVYYASGFADSIAGLLEARLRGDRALGSRTARVSPLYATCPDPELLASGLVDFAILIVNAYDADCDGKGRFERDPLLTQVAGEWQHVVRSQLRKAVAALSKARVKAAVVLVPMGWEVSPSENLYRKEAVGYYAFSPPEYAFLADYSSSERNWLAALNDLGAPLVNGFMPFRSFESLPHADTLFATDDLHLAAFGRGLVANALADYLERAKPWRR